MADERSESRSSGGTEAERRYDGGGQDTPMAQSEQARGNVEPETHPPDTEKPVETLRGRDGKPIAAENDSGVAWAEAEAKVKPPAA